MEPIQILMLMGLVLFIIVIIRRAVFCLTHKHYLLFIGHLIKAIAIFISPFVLLFSMMGYGMAGENAVNQGEVLRFQIFCLSLPVINIALFLLGHYIVKRNRDKQAENNFVDK